MQEEHLFQQFQSALFQSVGIHLRADEKWPLLLASFSHKELEEILKDQDVHSSHWAKVFHILNISETYLYRDPKQLDAIFDVIVPDLLKGKTNPELQIWSAGCSKGEEVYTLGILTKIYQRKTGREFPFRILGTDIQASSLQVARQGEYSTYSIRANLPETFYDFLQINGNTVRIVPDIKSHVQFFHRNLLEPGVGYFDLILCRNVLIYLSDDAKEKILQNLTKSLNDGGALVLGHSEYMGNLPAGLSIHSVSHKTTYYRFHKKQTTPIAPNLSSLPLTMLSQRKKPSMSENPLVNKSAPIPSPILAPSHLSSREKAIQAYKNGFKEQAMSLFIDSLYDEPKQIEAYYYLANHHWEAKEWKEARSFQAKARLIFKNDSSLADLLKKSGRWEESFSEFLVEDL